jgi:hypothetical protein
MKRSLATVLSIALLGATAGGAAAGELEIQPASPTSEQNVNVLVHTDMYGELCGSTLAVSRFTPFLPFTPPTGDIDVWLVPVMSSAACPAALAQLTVSLPVGTLSPGQHTVRLWHAANQFESATVSETLTFTVLDGASSELSLHGGRFTARVTWRAFDGSSGVAKLVPGSSNESGLFWFFDRGNAELLLKVLDACSYNGHFWVLGAGATNVELTISIEDNVTHELWSYTNPLGHPAGSFFDNEVFARACLGSP